MSDTNLDLLNGKITGVFGDAVLWIVKESVIGALAVGLFNMISNGASWFISGPIAYTDQEKTQAAIEQVSHALAGIASNLAHLGSRATSPVILDYPGDVSPLLGNPSYASPLDSRVEVFGRLLVKILGGYTVTGVAATDLEDCPDHLAPIRLEGFVDGLASLVELLDGTLHYTDPVDHIERGLARIIAESGGSGVGPVNLDDLITAMDTYFLIERSGHTWSISELMLAILNTGMIIYK